MKVTQRAKQSLGQNFLVDENMAHKIVEAMAIQADDIVIEIGPGLGMITGLLQKKAKHLYAVEIDQRFYDDLENKFAAYENFTLIREDFLKFDLSTIPGAKKIRIVGNIPYNITSPILFRVIEKRDKVKDLILLVQKEVGLRVVSEPHSKEYGILAVLSQAVADVTNLLKVPPTVFQPRPAVDSVLIRWQFTNARSKRIDDEIFFKALVKQAFNKRRKMLRNSLREYGDSTLLDFTRRPEQLSIDEWISLANELAQAREK